MNRRDFFKNLIGATVVVAVGPQLMSQVEDHEYKTVSNPEVSAAPERIFTCNQGLWVFQNEKMVAWSPLENIDLHYKIPTISTSLSNTIYGPEEISLDVSDLHVIDLNAFYNEGGKVRLLLAIIDEHEGTIKRMISDGLWIEVALSAPIIEHVRIPASFLCMGQSETEIQIL